MKIKEIKDPTVFIALKRICKYLVNQIWEIDLGSGEIEAEFRLAKERSKRFKEDIIKLTQLDTDLNWGQQKTMIDSKTWSISTSGDFNPWYNGELDLEDLLNSFVDAVEFEENVDDYIQHAEFIHYYKYLLEFAGISTKVNDAVVAIDTEIEEIKNILVDVATGVARIQDKNDQYKRLYKNLSDYCNNNSIDNPNEYSDLWEFYSYWKKNLKSYADRRAYVAKLYKNFLNKPNISTNITKLKNHTYVNEERLLELRKLKNAKADLSKLIKYCEEINIAFENKCYFATAILIRSIIDHIPPIFGFKTFSEVANNFGGKSFKDSMRNLDISSRKISDACLHTQIRKKEVLPNSTQVDFSNDLDVLLAEIYRLLK